MATKKSTPTSNPFKAGPGTSSKLSDFLGAGGPSARPPTQKGKSGGGPPQNKRNEGRKR